MNDNRRIQLAEIPIGGKEGLIWNRLHDEREETCETLIRTSGPDSDIYRELLQARLQKLDDALDRLMSGSYGSCSQCGQSINQIKLDTDPATSQCLDCSEIKAKVVSEAVVPGNVILKNANGFGTMTMGIER